MLKNPYQPEQHPSHGRLIAGGFFKGVIFFFRIDLMISRMVELIFYRHNIFR